MRRLWRCCVRAAWPDVRSGDAGRSAISSPPLLTYVGIWGTKGTDPGKLDEPTCIATDALGNAYLADAGSRFVDKFDWKGTPLLSFQDEGLK